VDLDAFESQLNDLLVEAFRSILKVEDRSIKSSKKIDLSVNEMHLIDAIGKDEKNPKTISEIADILSITLPSVTVAINKLLKKGHVQKIKCSDDGRIVFVILTKKGKKMYAAHRYFDENMVRSLSKDLSLEEKDAMLKGVINLNAFLKRRLKAMEE
jgi:DNA-binding MarR family transcriptional regulator